MSEAVMMTREELAAQAEDEAWDDFFDTQGARCCDCVSCNYYIPEYDPDATCVMVAAIYRILAAREAAHLVELDKIRAALELPDPLRRP